MVGRIKEKRRRRSKKPTHRDFEEQQLQDSLTAGESRVANRFASDVQELGEIVRVGDGMLSVSRNLTVTVLTDVVQPEPATALCISPLPCKHKL